MTEIQIKEKRIFLRGRIRLIPNPLDLLTKLEPIFSNKEENVKNIIIDLTEAEFVYPNALFLFIALKNTAIKKGTVLEFDVLKGSKIHEYLDYSGCCNEFNIKKFPSNEKRSIGNSFGIIPVETGKEIVDTEIKAEELANFLVKWQEKILPQLETNLIDSLDEIFININQHSECEKYYLMGQYYPESKRVRFVFYDNGMGIKNHLTRKDYESMHSCFKKVIDKNQFECIRQLSANHAILHAANYGVSATDYQSNSGAGIHSLITEMMFISKGKLLIISGNGAVAWEEGKTEPCFDGAIPFELSGTLISLDLNCDSDIIFNETKG